MTIEQSERISLCYNQLQIYIPKTKEDIARARKLLDLLEEEVNEESKPPRTPLPETPHTQYCLCDRCETNRREIKESEIAPAAPKLTGSPQTSPQDERQGHHTERPAIAQKMASMPIQTVIDTPQVEASTPSARDQDGPSTKTSEIENPAHIANLEPFSCAKFYHGESEEKFYRSLFYIEHEDGRVMLRYMSSKYFMQKADVEALPFPIPRNFTPLKTVSSNKRTAIRFYREYLGLEAQKASDADVQEESERLEKLRKVAEVNKDRWKEKVETEMSPRTRGLRAQFGGGLVIKS